jgi:hypothetical protein
MTIPCRPRIVIGQKIELVCILLGDQTPNVRDDQGHGDGRVATGYLPRYAMEGRRRVILWCLRIFCKALQEAICASKPNVA